MNAIFVGRTEGPLSGYQLPHLSLCNGLFTADLEALMVKWGFVVIIHGYQVFLIHFVTWFINVCLFVFSPAPEPGY